MMKRPERAAFILIFCVTCCLGVAACAVFSVFCGSVELDFSAEFYYVAYESATDSVSASSVSSLVRSYGGAGYIVECDGEYYVTLSCYYSRSEAEEVCDSLNEAEFDCLVVSVSAENYKLVGGNRKYKSAYEGYLGTLFSLSRLCYELANSLDSLAIGQDDALSVLGDIGDSLDGLAAANAKTVFNEDLKYLQTEFSCASGGYIFSCDVRRLQIAMCDAIVNVRLNEKYSVK